MKKDRFVKLTDATRGVDWALVERARYLSGLKGYVTNLEPGAMDGAAVIAAYHELLALGAKEATLLDPDGEIRYIIENKRVLVLKEELNTVPRFFYFYAT